MKADENGPTSVDYQDPQSFFPVSQHPPPINFRNDDRYETTDNTDIFPIQAVFADDSLSIYEPYISFLDYNSSKWQIHVAITTSKPVKDFKWLWIQRDWDSHNIMGVSERSSLPYFTETQTVIVSFLVAGITQVAYPPQGISFIDDAGNRLVHTLTIGNYGMDADEYDGPDLVFEEISPTPIDIGELIITAVKALQSQDEIEINKLIHPYLGIILFARPGAYETVTLKKRLQMSDPPSGYSSMPLREPVVEDYSVKWEELPDYDCLEEWKWNKPSGIYAEERENRMSAVEVAKRLSNAVDIPICATLMKKFEDFENNYLYHYSVIVIGDVECYWNYLDFTITFIDGAWYLTIINMAPICA